MRAQETHLTKIDGPLIDRVLYAYTAYRYIYIYIKIGTYTMSDLIPSLCSPYEVTSYTRIYMYKRAGQIRRRP